MDKLPTEILHNVFLLLPLLQKRICMLVCRQWEHIIRARSLLHTVYLENEQSVKVFKKLIKHNPQFATQVEELTLYSHFTNGKSYYNQVESREYFLLFPNLKELRMRPTRSSCRQQPEDKINLKESQLSTRIPRHLQRVEDFGDCRLTTFLTDHDLCRQLVSLKLVILRGHTKTILSSLKGMPALKELTVTAYGIDVDILETIHSNIPSLDSLEISSGTFQPSPLLKREIKPATRLTRLKLSGVGCEVKESHKIQWFQYIYEKYPNLKCLIFKVTMRNRFNREWDNIYTAEYPLILYKLGSRLETLSLSAVVDKDYKIIKNLDSYGCQIKEIEIDMGFGVKNMLNALAKTEQFNLIEKLTLHDIKLLNSDQCFSTLRDMKKLKSLDLYFHKYDPDISYSDDEDEEIRQFKKNKTVDLVTLLDAIPETVESIAIRYAQLDHQEPIYAFDHVKNIIISNVDLNKRIDSFISISFPNLTCLILLDCHQYSDTFELPNIHLSYLEIYKSANYRFVHLSLITEKDKKIRFYSTNTTLFEGYPALQNPIKPISKEKLADKLLRSVICGSVKKLVLNGREADLDSDAT